VENDMLGLKIIKKLVFFIIAAVIIAGIGATSYGYFIVQKLSNGEKNTKKVDVNKPINVLLLGVDAGNYEAKTESKNRRRSDTIMVVRYNPEDKKAYILSIPRDTKVNINGHTEKINVAHAIGGHEKTIEVVENLLDINIDYYAKIDYKGFRECVDAIGGVDMIIPRDMHYDAYDINIHFNKGETVHLDGEKAEQFVRWRKNNNGEGYAMGDLGRISTQQEFMLKVIEKLKTPAGMLKIIPLMNTAAEYVETNISSKAMISYAIKLKGIESSNIEKRILEGEPKYVGGVSYFVYSHDENAEYLENFKRNYVENNNENIDRAQVSITILNSTGVNGLALSYKEKMENLGYEVVEIGNYSERLEETIINDFSGKEYGDFVKQDIKLGKVVEKQDVDSKVNVVVILGTDSVK
jgi:polyisoprenyl-teichoic acid--peptidoglycan teichoic acid transferase